MFGKIFSAKRLTNFVGCGIMENSEPYTGKAPPKRAELPVLLLHADGNKGDHLNYHVGEEERHPVGECGNSQTEHRNDEVV